MREWLTGLLLGALFVASVLNQLPIKRWMRLVARHDQFTFLPFWAFFAPEPGYAATHLVYRDYAGGVWSDWTELELPDMGSWRWIWNPGRFERKALQDLLNGLVRAAYEVKDPQAVQLTGCYLGVAAWVAAQGPLEPGAMRRQFALLQATGHGDQRALTALLVSREYSLA